MEFKFLFSVTLILFSVIDILGSIPIVINLKNQGHRIESGKASLIALGIMITFLFIGERMLHLFGVDVQSFAVAGAIIIFIIGIEMIMGIRLFRDDPDTKSSTIVPLAFPLIAGAGTLTTIITLKAKYSTEIILLAILINMLIVFLVLRASGWIGKKLGRGGANVLRKVFGIILLAIAVKLFKENFHLIIQTK